MTLRELQENFGTLLLQPLGGIENIPPAFRQNFVQDHIPVHERIKIYHTNVIGGVSAALCTNFPLLEKLVGDEFLSALARAFVIAHPPRSGCLLDYGAGFDDFIAAHTACASMPYLADVARLELAVHHATHAHDDAPLAANELSSIAPDHIASTPLKLRCAARLMHSPYPLLQLRDYCRAPQEFSAPDLSQPTETYLLISRDIGFDVQFILLSRAEHMMLDRLTKGDAIGAALEASLNNAPDFDITAFLQKHIALGSFQSLDAGSAHTKESA